jgi:hypothetical protein
MLCIFAEYSAQDDDGLPGRGRRPEAEGERPLMVKWARSIAIMLRKSQAWCVDRYGPSVEKWWNRDRRRSGCEVERDAINHVSGVLTVATVRSGPVMPVLPVTLPT